MSRFALPDVYSEDLILLICGSAASRRSADTGTYYAGRGNKFPDYHPASVNFFANISCHTETLRV